MTLTTPFLRKIPLFSNLPEKDLERLCQLSTEIKLPAGAELFSEGSPGEEAYVIKEGEIEIYKDSGGRSVLLAVRKTGEVIGEMSLLDHAPRSASGRARVDSVLVSISHQQLDDLINANPAAARGMLYTFSTRLKSTELLLQQSEKMAQLGVLTAGIAHELNNPASAVRRGADQLRAALHELEEAQMDLGSLTLSPEQREQVEALRQLVTENAAGSNQAAAELGPLERSDRAAELENWLDKYCPEDAWELAPVLVEAGLSVEMFEHFAGMFGLPDGENPVAALARWLSATSEVYRLLEELGQGAGRVSEIVGALKSYAYLDQAPIQMVDLQAGLESTLVMLRGALKKGVEVHREYAPDLPRIQAYGSELNQVWTNLIANAIDALDSENDSAGEITIRTRQDESWIFVEVEDNGPGIPEDIQGKIFSPFFTTKPVGSGSGLGLYISANILHKHGGELKVISRPGKTRFIASLPVQTTVS